MSSEAEIRAQANVRLKDHFSRDRSNDYDTVQVLLLYWEKSDSDGYREEAIELENLFTQHFRYPVQRYEIPANHSQLMLHGKISGFLTLLMKPRSLGIIHYGGHGDADDDDEGFRRSVWASHGNADDPDDGTLTWSDIQPMLKTINADILLILDCCFAAQAARNRDRVIPHNVELIAACAMRLMTPLPKKALSFTGCFAKEIKRALDEKSCVIVKDIHGLLSRGDRGLIQTPIYFPPKGNKSIRLDPLPSGSTSTTRTESQTSLFLQMDVSRSLSKMTLEEILSWLTLNAPRDITGVKITALIDRASKIQQFIADAKENSSDSSPMRMSRLPESSRTELQRVWNTFNTELAVSAASVSSEPEPAGTGSSIESFVDSFKSKFSNLHRTLTRNLLSLPAFDDESVLELEAHGTKAEQLGLSEALNIRLAGLQEPPWMLPLRASFLTGMVEPIDDVTNTVFRGEVEELGHVLIEYKYYHTGEFFSTDAHRRRIGRLLRALRSVKSDLFRTPECVGYVAEDLRCRYGLVFRTPPWAAPTVTPLYRILHDHLGSPSSMRKPSLGERYHIALAIGRAIAQWHLCGWVHQGIASYNIFFFSHHTGQPDYSNPYLLGFEYSREYDATSVLRADNTGLADMYRHPARQGQAPTEPHTKFHDIFSFGLLLVEIGLWKPIDFAFKTVIEKKGIKSLAETILNKGRGLLGHTMGLSYEAAALRCLSGEFGIKMEDMNEKILSREFEFKVLDQLEIGTHLDGSVDTKTI